VSNFSWHSGTAKATSKTSAPEGQDWFLSYHCFTKYVKVTFFRGTSLRPIPPAESKHPEVRYYHIHEDGDLDEELMTRWIEQASKLPSEPLF